VTASASAGAQRRFAAHYNGSMGATMPFHCLCIPGVKTFTCVPLPPRHSLFTGRDIIRFGLGACLSSPENVATWARAG